MSRELSVDEFNLLPSEIQIEILENLDLDLNELRVYYRAVKDPYVKNYIRDRGVYIMANADPLYLLTVKDFAALSWRKDNNIPLVDLGDYDEDFLYLLVKLIATNNIDGIDWIYNNYPDINYEYYIQDTLPIALVNGYLDMADWLYNHGFRENRLAEEHDIDDIPPRILYEVIEWLVNKEYLNETTLLSDHLEYKPTRDILVRLGADLHDPYTIELIDEYREYDPKHEVVQWYDNLTK